MISRNIIVFCPAQLKNNILQEKKQQKYSVIIYITALFLLAAGLPLSVFLMSAGTGLMLVAFLLHGESGAKFRQLKKSPVFLSLAALYAVHLIGLIYTTDFKYAFNDIKVKIPLLLFPAAFITLPKPGAEIIRYIIYTFIIAVLISTIYGFLVYHQIVPAEKDISDVRNISVFISHVRLALLICIAVYILIYNAFLKEQLSKILALALCCWLIYFLYLLESGTGFIILLITGFLVLTGILFRVKNRLVQFISAAIIMGTLILVVNSGKNIITEYYTPKENLSDLDLYTSQGNFYHHDLDYLALENGYYVGLYQCREEMIPAWNNRSKIHFDSLDRKGQRIGFTLMRYLTSKGLRKDAEGVAGLTKSDIENIENGIANVDYITKTGIQRRIEQILFEFDNYFVTRNAGGNSLTQRIEYWKTGWQIFRSNPVAGVGTGDAQLAFNEEYRRQRTTLPEEHWHRSHNQFLAFMVTFGVIGLVLFIIVLIIPLTEAWKKLNILYLLFFICITLSFITEDTLETQAGVTLFAFFNCFFLYFEVNNSRKNNVPEEARKSFAV